MGLPGLAGAEHIGITVPNLEAATRFFVDVIGCKVVFALSRRTMTGCNNTSARIRDRGSTSCGC
jgi:catechol 2,3-dioxygenase-like lactoylglutathione lyase family enzyme